MHNQILVKADNWPIIQWSIKWTVKFELFRFSVNIVPMFDLKLFSEKKNPEIQPALPGGRDRFLKKKYTTLTGQHFKQI